MRYMLLDNCSSFSVKDDIKWYKMKGKKALRVPGRGSGKRLGMLIVGSEKRE